MCRMLNDGYNKIFLISLVKIIMTKTLFMLWLNPPKSSSDAHHNKRVSQFLSQFQFLVARPKMYS